MSEYVFGKEVKAVMPTYISFLMGRLIEIWQAWDGNDPEFALRKAIRLVLFLPKDLKKKMEDEANSITKEINQAYNVGGVDWYTRQQNRNRAARSIAVQRLPSFLDKMVELLDERGYLEKVKEYRKGRFQQRA